MLDGRLQALVKCTPKALVSLSTCWLFFGIELVAPGTFQFRLLNDWVDNATYVYGSWFSN